MEIKEFQAKLSEALGLAVENGKKIHADTVEGIFAGNGLTEGQMQKVYEYLAIQGIQVDGRGPGSAAADGQTGSEAPVTTAAGIPADSEAVPLTQEETKGSETGRVSKKAPGRIIHDRSGENSQRAEARGDFHWRYDCRREHRSSDSYRNAA